MRLTLIRNATLIVELAGRRLLYDPLLGDAGAYPPVEGTPNPRRNPLVGLPRPAAEIVEGLDGLLVSHLHGDHFDPAAISLLPKGLPLFCQHGDEWTIREHGFTAVTAVGVEVAWRGIRITRIGGHHGTGEIGERMGRVSGFVLRIRDEPTLYLAGDTIWCEEVEAAIDEFEPAVIVVHAGGARFDEGDPIIMTPVDVQQVVAAAPTAKVVCTHMEALNHCTVTRDELRQLPVLVPGDGETVDF